MEVAVSWLLGFLGRYPELLVSLACFLLLFHWLNHRRRDDDDDDGGLSMNWPVVGAVPAITANAGRVHDFLTESLRAATGLSFVMKGPWGSPVDALVTADPANVAHVFTSNFGNYPKGADFAALFDVLGGGIFNADGASWAFQRRKAHSLLSDPRFRSAVSAATARKLRRGLLPLLEDLAGDDVAVVDLQDVFVRLTFDLTATFVFGTDPGCLAPGFPHVPLAAAMDDVEEVLFYRHVTPVPWLRLQTWLGTGHHRKMADARRVLDASIAEFIALRRRRLAADGEAAGEDDDAEAIEADLLTSYLGCEEEVGKSGAEFEAFLRDTTFNLMVAGRDTTSSALTWFFWLLTSHPDVERKILDELRAHPPSSSSSSGGGAAVHTYTAGELKRLVYLHAALSESLRLYPPVPFEHKAAAAEDTLPSGARVGPSRRVIVSFYSMGRMEAVWGKDCAEFRPERWLTAAGRFRHEPSCRFVAFNVGPRTCLGRDLAYAQMKAVVAAVLPRFRVEVEAGAVVRPKLSIILHMKDGLKVRVHRRGEEDQMVD